MAHFDLQSYARRGAAARVTELNQELESIFQAFPDLRPNGATGGRPRAQKVIVNHEEQVAQPTPPVRRRRRKMTAAQRKAVGERMRKYWANRKRAQK